MTEEVTEGYLSAAVSLHRMKASTLQLQLKSSFATEHSSWSPSEDLAALSHAT